MHRSRAAVSAPVIDTVSPTAPEPVVMSRIAFTAPSCLVAVHMGAERPAAVASGVVTVSKKCFNAPLRTRC
ncbi:hypothetical protein K7G98_12415 [Saccharothrix sp. MB29]|nr:hypothetical protein [Saccharothrix sp. MB29]